MFFIVFFLWFWRKWLLFFSPFTPNYAHQPDHADQTYQPLKHHGDPLAERSFSPLPPPFLSHPDTFVADHNRS